MRSILTTILKSNGFTGIRAHGNANRAMSDMLERVPDAVLIQWVLPDSDAETMIRTLRTEAMRPLCFAPVIVLSANVSRAVITEVLASGASTLLRTPVSPKTLLDRLQWITSDSRAFVHDGRRYVLQETDDATDISGVDPGWGLMDLDAGSRA